jgi:hypothetical protein
MVDTSPRFIAFIDILGFKDFVMRNTHEYVLEKLTTLTKGIEHIKTTGAKKEVKDGFDGAELTPYVFSDSVAIFTNNNSHGAAKLLLYACQYLFVNSILTHLPVKGAMAHGTITLDVENSIFFGQPIIDAYLLQEEVKYYGLILHDSMDKHLPIIDNKNQSLKKLLLNTKTPTKSGSITYNNLMLKFGKDKAGNDINLTEAIEKLYTTVSGAARVYVDNTIEIYNKMTEKTSANIGVANSGAKRSINQQR